MNVARQATEVLLRWALRLPRQVHRHEDRQARNPKARPEVHQLAHVFGVFSQRARRGHAKLIVECAVLIVCSALGLPTDGESVRYLAGWGGDGALE